MDTGPVASRSHIIQIPHPELPVNQFKLGSHNVAPVGFDFHIAEFQLFVLVGKSPLDGIEFDDGVNALPE